MASFPGEQVVVVGGGIIGLATAYRLLQARPGLGVVVLEKEPEVGRHQSGHNSGVLHAGLSYRSGSLKARLAVAGYQQMVAFCAAHGVPYECCGKLVLAVDDTESARLRALFDQGRRNGLQGLRWLTANEIPVLEPHARGVAALHVPGEGIVDYGRVCAALAGEVTALGGRVVTGAEVQALRRRGSTWSVVTTAGDVEATFVVNCAGLQSDRIARRAGVHPPARIVPFRGEYYRLRPDREHLVRHLLYPVPPAGLPFLGVHFTRRITGGVDAGPNAVLALAREGYRRRDVRVRDAAATLGYPGLWAFFARYAGMCWEEAGRGLSPTRFAAALQRLVPEITADDLLPGGAGVRAQAMAPNGTLLDDFCFVDGPASLHLINAPSPGATASLAIGGVIVERCRLALGWPADAVTRESVPCI